MGEFTEEKTIRAVAIGNDYEELPTVKPNHTRSALKKIYIAAITLTLILLGYVTIVHGDCISDGVARAVEPSVNHGSLDSGEIGSFYYTDVSSDVLSDDMFITTVEVKPVNEKRDDNSDNSDSSNNDDSNNDDNDDDKKKKPKTPVQKVFANPAIKVVVVIFGFFFINAFIIVIHHIFRMITNTDKLYRNMEQHISPF